MARATLLDAARAEKGTGLASEIEHFMNVDDREYAYDEVSALFDAMSLAEQNRGPGSRAVIDRARALLIDAGFYRVMPDDEAANTFRSNGGAPEDFRLKGVRYTTDFTVDEWQWPPGGE
jgi:hypothetical protein